MSAQTRGSVRPMAYFLLALLLGGCTHVSVTDCPENGVLGNNEPGTARLRTSNHRVVLADTAAVAARFLPYAIMSTYAYKIGDRCKDSGNEIRVDAQRAADLSRWLDGTTEKSNAWRLAPSAQIHGLPNSLKQGCEDELGLMFHVWHRRIGVQEQVVMSFRGTSGAGDWQYGNFWWFSRAFTSDTQLSRARSYAAQVMRYFDEKAMSEGAPPPEYVTTGHSLGGSLAQHVLYAAPDRVQQSIVFDPSSVTGFVDPSISRADRVSACSCKSALNPEARIIRIYQTYEILSNLRLFHKLFLPPERHVQEVRFPFEASWNPVSRHGMYEFSKNLHSTSGTRKQDEVRQSWFASKEKACTVPLISKQLASCSVVVTPDAATICPQ